MRRSTTRGRLGDTLVVCDRTGFTRWRSECVKEWNGALVHRSVYEARHPQDSIRARREDFRIPDARPERTIEDETFVGPAQVIIALAATPGDYGIAVTSMTGFSAGDWVRVFLDNTDTFLTRLVSAPIRIDSVNIRIDSLTLLIDSPYSFELATPLPASAAVGNLVIRVSN